MPVLVACPNPTCGQKFPVDPHSMGQVARCNTCGRSFRLTSDTLVSVQQARQSAAPVPDSLGRLGRFELRQKLGRGAFGIVYRAYDPSSGREVALKVPNPDTVNTPERVERFLREARALARLQHPHIVPFYEAGQADGRYFIASAFIARKSLAVAIREKGIDCRRAARIVRSLAEALAYAHQQGIVHRDVKPANVMMDEQDQPLLMDFGLAAEEQEGHEKLTKIGSVLGTPSYIAPEYAEGYQGEARPAADQYALGVILYELLTGLTPFAGTPAIILYHNLNTEPPPPRTHRPDVPAALEAICLKAMAKKPQERYPDCQELADALGVWLEVMDRERGNAEAIYIKTNTLTAWLEDAERERQRPAEEQRPILAIKTLEAEREQQRLAEKKQQEEEQRQLEEAEWERQRLAEEQRRFEEAEWERQRLKESAVLDSEMDKESVHQRAEGHAWHGWQRQWALVAAAGAAAAFLLLLGLLNLLDERFRMSETVPDWIRRQEEHENELVQLVRAALERNHGQLSEVDNSGVAILCNQYHISRERAQDIIQEVQDHWQKEQVLQKDGEAKLTQLIHSAVVRNHGQLSERDNSSVVAICTQNHISRERALDITREVQDYWQKQRALQKDGEAKLAQMIRAAVERNHGQIGAADTAAAATLCNKYDVSRERVDTMIHVEQDRWQKEQDLQHQGEKKLAQQIRTALDRPHGKLTAADNPDVTALCSQYHISRERSDVIIRMEKERWQKEGETRLAQLIRYALERSRGRFSVADNLDADALCSHYHVSRERAWVVNREEQERWQKEQAKQPRPGDIITNFLDMKFAFIPAGTFLMDSTESEADSLLVKRPQHKVTISQPFYLGISPVTQEQWWRVMGSNPSWFCSDGEGKNRVKGLDTRDFPVENVRFGDCQEYCRRLSQREGKSYRLPTEAEWEYACRAGSTTAYCFGDDPAKLGEFAWFAGNSGGKIHPVGQKKANAWGLYDMHGNVWQWCQWDENFFRSYIEMFEQSYSDESFYAKKMLSAGWTTEMVLQGFSDDSFFFAVRGGSWRDISRNCRSVDRLRVKTSDSFRDAGCRLVFGTKSSMP